MSARRSVAAAVSSNSLGRCGGPPVVNSATRGQPGIPHHRGGWSVWTRSPTAPLPATCRSAVRPDRERRSACRVRSMPKPRTTGARRTGGSVHGCADRVDVHPLRLRAVAQLPVRLVVLDQHQRQLHLDDHAHQGAIADARVLA